MGGQQRTSGSARDLICRFNSPGASTVETDRYQEESTRLQAIDPISWELLQALLMDAYEEGLPPGDNAELYDACPTCSYRAPVGKRAFERARRQGVVPWVGELRIEGEGGADGAGPHWRSYFHDLTVEDEMADEVLMSSLSRKMLGKKKAHGGGGFRLNAQDRDILGAIDEARRWAKNQRGYQLRVLAAGG